MNRGDLVRVSMPLIDRSGRTATRLTPKYVVLLQNGTDFAEADMVVLVASSKRPPDRALAAYEVEIGPSHGLHHETVIDCRWPYTVLKRRIRNGRHISRLPDDVMAEVDVAIAIGLGLV